MAELNLNAIIKSLNLRWFGQIERMGEVRGVKRAYLDRLTGRRLVSPPRFWWSDLVEADLREPKPKWLARYRAGSNSLENRILSIRRPRLGSLR